MLRVRGLGLGYTYGGTAVFISICCLLALFICVLILSYAFVLDIAVGDLGLELVRCHGHRRRCCWWWQYYCQLFLF